jgi:hypothetical protein
MTQKNRISQTILQYPLLTKFTLFTSKKQKIRIETHTRPSGHFLQSNNQTAAIKNQKAKDAKYITRKFLRITNQQGNNSQVFKTIPLPPLD